MTWHPCSVQLITLHTEVFFRATIQPILTPILGSGVAQLCHHLFLFLSLSLLCPPSCVSTCHSSLRSLPLSPLFVVLSLPLSLSPSLRAFTTLFLSLCATSAACLSALVFLFVSAFHSSSLPFPLYLCLFTFISACRSHRLPLPRYLCFSFICVCHACLSVPLRPCLSLFYCLNPSAIISTPPFLLCVP